MSFSEWVPIKELGKILSLLLMGGNVTFILCLLCKPLLPLILSVKLVFVPHHRWGKKRRMVQLNMLKVSYVTVFLVFPISDLHAQSRTHSANI